MKLRSTLHLLLLIATLAFIFCILLMPVWAMGYPYEVPQLASILDGTFSGSRLLSWFISPFSSAFSAYEPLGWLHINVAILCLSLIPLWIILKMIFGVRVAFISIILFPFVPAIWVEALRIDGYVFGYLFLFLSIFCFNLSGLPPLPKNKSLQSKIIFTVLSGIFLGLALASRDAFILFLPGVTLAVIFFGILRWKRMVMGLIIFLSIVFITYSLPVFSTIINENTSVIQKVGKFVGMSRGTPSTLHFYPDIYTYEFEKEEYLMQISKDLENKSALERLGAENYMQLFGAHSRTFLSTLFIGSWLMFGVLTLLFAQEFIGGIFLWLFIIPGAVFLYKKKKNLCLFLVWLPISLEITTRFVFFAQRPHIMDYAWILVIFAAIGVVGIVDGIAVKSSFKRMGFLVGISLIIVLQLLQANRSQFAKFYNKSNTRNIYSATSILNELPENSVVAYPSNRMDLLFLSNVESIQFHTATINRLSEEKLKFAFDNYKVTHAIGYTKNISELLPSNITIIPPPDNTNTKPSLLIERALHWLR